METVRINFRVIVDDDFKSLSASGVMLPLDFISFHSLSYRPGSQRVTGQPIH